MEFHMNSIKMGGNGWSGHYTNFIRNFGKRTQSFSNGMKVESYYYIREGTKANNFYKIIDPFLW